MLHERRRYADEVNAVREAALRDETALIATIQRIGSALASELDLERSAADRKFFGARKKILVPILTQLVAAERAVEDYDLGDGSRLQVRVEMGDQILDRGVSDGNTRTKLAARP